MRGHASERCPVGARANREDTQPTAVYTLKCTQMRRYPSPHRLQHSPGMYTASECHTMWSAGKHRMHTNSNVHIYMCTKYTCDNARVQPRFSKLHSGTQPQSRAQWEHRQTQNTRKQPQCMYKYIQSVHKCDNTPVRTHFSDPHDGVHTLFTPSPPLTILRHSNRTNHFQNPCEKYFLEVNRRKVTPRPPQCILGER